MGKWMWGVCVCVCAHARACTHACSVVSNSVNLCTVAHQAPLSMEFSRQEYWRGLPFPSPRDLSNPEVKLVSFVSPALVGDFFTTAPPWIIGGIW